MNGAVYVAGSRNRKILGSKPVDATYASIQTSCPKSCPLMGEGCYAELGYVGITSHRLDHEADGQSALDTARAEAEAIDNAYEGGQVPTGRFLRIHVAGDSRSKKGTSLINNAIKRWIKRGGSKAWSYTHSWSNVPRSYWSNVSVLASIDKPEQAVAARKHGYAPALVVDIHPSKKAYKLSGSDVKWIPCPQQTCGVGCSDCRLCFDANRLFTSNMGIAFAAHGVMKNQVQKKHLTVIR